LIESIKSWSRRQLPLLSTGDDFGKTDIA